MPDLNLSVDFFDHPKTRRLVALLGPGSELLPIRLWCYAGKHYFETGEIDGSVPEIEAFAGWRGRSGRAVEALVRVGFLEPYDGGYRIHDWLDHAGHISAYKAKASAMAREKWRRVKEKAAELTPEINARGNATSITDSNAVSYAKARQGKARQGSPLPGGEEFSRDYPPGPRNGTRLERSGPPPPQRTGRDPGAPEWARTVCQALQAGYRIDDPSADGFGPTARYLRWEQGEDVEPPPVPVVGRMPGGAERVLWTPSAATTEPR